MEDDDEGCVAVKREGERVNVCGNNEVIIRIPFDFSVYNYTTSNNNINIQYTRCYTHSGVTCSTLEKSYACITFLPVAVKAATVLSITFD